MQGESGHRETLYCIVNDSREDGVAIEDSHVSTVPAPADFKAAALHQGAGNSSSARPPPHSLATTTALDSLIPPTVLSVLDFFPEKYFATRPTGD